MLRDNYGQFVNYYKSEELINTKFGKLTVIKTAGKNKHGHPLLECLCDCGRTHITPKCSLLRQSKATRSCGCNRATRKTESFFRFPKGVFAKAAKELSLSKDHQSVIKAARIRHQGISKKRNWNLTPTQCITLCLTACYYCKFYEDGKIGIDRLNSELGYIDGNCVPCCKNCNFAKNDMTLEEFRDWLKRLWYNYGVSASAD